MSAAADTGHELEQPRRLRCVYCGGLAGIGETCPGHTDLPSLDPNLRLADELWTCHDAALMATGSPASSSSPTPRARTGPR